MIRELAYRRGSIRNKGWMRWLASASAMAIVVSTAVSSPAVAATSTIKVLQMNLCNSGKANCYKDGKAIDEAREMIAKLQRPTVVFINEICRGDEKAIAKSDLYSDYPATLFAETNVKCSNGKDYGSAMLFGGSEYLAATGGQFTNQDTSSEQRAYACARFGSFFSCVTHLSKDEPTALKQCNELTKKILPEFQASRKEASMPAIVSGDLNLEYDPDDAENVQKCVPSGWTRKGDGEVQHVMVSPGFTDMSASTESMSYTDHNALVITVTAPW